ncbi:hypothetical protein ALC57_05093 [Trachymyrmex cornetzi]|uniref:Endonuclease/exonuclease/phosphatase domain-containing protein n=1 Tax=Trachymyrmex cornetzi TaxID=471704 RepID=A0A151JBK4_9HYME|nr:hypothetical protein ALC57_05093 [Trachymyrmex cornetzi]
MMTQCLAEWGGGLAIAADPYYIPENHPNWAGDSLGWVAMACLHARGTPPMIPISAGEGFLLVEWGPIDVVGCYFPPHLGRKEYGEALESLGEQIHHRSPRPVIVGGDFTAHSTEWGSPSTDSRGVSTLQWAARLGLGCVQIPHSGAPKLPNAVQKPVESTSALPRWPVQKHAGCSRSGDFCTLLFCRVESLSIEWPHKGCVQQTHSFATVL